MSFVKSHHLLAVLVAAFCAFRAAAADTFGELKPARVAEIAAMLPETATGFGRPCADRKFWEDPALRSRLRKTVAEAEKLLSKPMPAWSDDAYLEFSRKGTRPAGEKMQGQRSRLLGPLVLAECLENRGRFTAKLNEILEEYAKEPTWTLAAHDRSLACFRRESYSVDLRSSAFGFELAQALYLLGGKVAPETREHVMAALRERVFVPVQKSLETGKGSYWLGSKKSPV